MGSSVATTYVYGRTSLPTGVGVSLQMLGPQNLSGAKLEVLRLSPNNRVLLLSVPRALSEGLYCLNVPFALVPPPSTYIASLQILLRGHGVSSMIWWRWRTAQAAIGSWVTDSDTHEVVVSTLGPTRYRLRIKGVKTVGYDNINVDIDPI